MRYCLFTFSIALLFIPGFSIAQQGDALNAEEKILFNAKIFTSDLKQPYAEAVFIHGKKIIAAGNLDEVKRFASKQVVLIDMKGGCVLPGLIDSHTHAVEGGDGLLKANLFDDLVDIKQLSDYVKQVKENKKQMTGDFVLIDGINISLWAQLGEVKSVFDNGEYENQPVWLRGSDGHTSWANKAALKRAGIDKQFIESLKGEDVNYFGFDSNKEPNGFITERGQRKIDAVLPQDEIDYDKSAEKALEYNNAFGITAWLDPSSGNTTNKTAKILLAYAHMAEQKKLTAHVATTIVANADADPQPQIDFIKSLQKKYNQPNVSVLGFKIFADGVVEHPTHTAALSKPYIGTNSKGVLMYNAEKFKHFVIAADKQNILVHVHAIGDRAVTKTLDGFEAARRANPNSRLPHTITHMQFVLPKDFARFKELNALASLQLLWAFGDVTTIDIVKPYMDPELYQYQYPARSLLQAGTIICGASDWPVSTANPFEAIYNAETRRGPKGVLDSTQCVPRTAMLQAYTINAAKALLQEKNIGSIEAGKSADLILIDRDILTADAQSFKESKIVWTMFEGHIVYKQKNINH
ncbi:MAG: amidohydrolase [Bacteroidetes bacterium]|nr:amidohydrolase [Bacteroidota bacterium]